MQLEIIKHMGWRKTYLKLIDKNRRSSLKELSFNNEKTIVEIDLNTYKYISFTDKKHQTEIIILSENLSQIELKYNRKIKKYVANLMVNNVRNYGVVETFTLKDEINLFYREKNTKKINLLIPANYNKNKKYGLIIMFDSQNIFDKAKVGNYTKRNDPYGGWQIETTLAQLKSKYPNEEYLVCGIECADLYRELELSMDNSFGPKNPLAINEDFVDIGYLDYLDNFIMFTLLPLIKEKYFIDKKKIGISGASAGGTACHYLGIKHYDLYQFILCFTPASGFYSDDAWQAFYQKLKLSDNQEKLPIFFYFQGKKGWLEHLLHKLNQNLIDNLKTCGYPEDKIIYYLEPQADHNELAWRYGFNYGLYTIHKSGDKN